MRRGIGPIVAVVLLIAIAIVSAVGLYFWAGGIATRHSTTDTPIAISATVLDAANGKVAVANLGDEPLITSFLYTTAGTTCNFSGEVTIPPNQQAVCTMPPKRGEILLYGPETGQAVVILPPGDVAEVTFQADSFGANTWNANLPGGTFDSNTTSGSVKLRGSAPTFTGEWPMFHHDLAHSGTTSDAGPVAKNVLWSYATGGQISSSPAVSGGVVYIGSDDSSVYAINATNGTVLWSYATGGQIDSSPAVSGGVVYFGSRDDKVYALYTNGTQKWNYSAGGIVASSPAVSDSVVYVNSLDGKVYAIHSDNGTQKWNHSVGGASSPAISGGYVYVGSAVDNKVYALSASDGTELWNYTTAGSIASSPAVSGGIVYIGEADTGKLYALNAATGAKIWDYQTGAPIHSSPAVSGGVVYVGSYDDSVYALNAATGAYIRSYDTGSLVHSSPAVSNGVVYVGSGDSYIYAFDASTGEQVWNYSTGIALRSSPAVVGGVAYIGSGNNNVYAFGGYMRNGTYLSEVRDSGHNNTNWTSFTWNNVTPANADLLLYVNVTNSTGSGSWVAATNGSSAGVGRYAQFKAELGTVDSLGTPVLSSTTAAYQRPDAELTYTANSESGLVWVALNQTCGGSTVVLENEAAGGYFYSNTITNSTSCCYLVWGPGLANTSRYEASGTDCDAAAPAPDCDDADVCTDDAFDPGLGCVHTPVSCDDFSVCTDDACDPVLGCVYTPAFSCDDGNLCTDDACDPVMGCFFTPVLCDDANPCTTDECDPGFGCFYTPIVPCP